jgi:putative addiction module killer protein
LFEIRQTETYRRWFLRLRDPNAQKRILARVVRLSQGLFGDTKPVGEGVFELRIDYGPGYRVYYFRRGLSVVILLAGGDKRSQARDIKIAIALSKEAKDAI